MRVKQVKEYLEGRTRLVLDELEIDPEAEVADAARELKMGGYLTDGEDLIQTAALKSALASNVAAIGSLDSPSA